MKTTTSILISFFFLAAIFAFNGCSKDDDGENTPLTSAHNQTLSHNNGQACISCHKSGGSGKGWFNVAGSVYKADLTVPDLNGTVYLWSGMGGTGNLVATIEVDGLGNFFTTSSVLPGSGAYPQIKGSSGNYRSMPMMTTTGNCNACHGVSVAHIWIN